MLWHRENGSVLFSFMHKNFPRGGMKLPLHLSDRRYGICRGQRFYTGDVPSLKQTIQP